MFKKSFFLFLLSMAFANADACLYFAPDYKGTITENTREFFLYHDSKNVHLVLKTHLQAMGGLPKRLAWVIPFPALPIKYEESDPRLFEELFQQVGFANAFAGGIPKGGIDGAAMPRSASPVKIHQVEVVGNYKVHPLEIVSDADVKSTATVLDSWLKQKGFITIPFDLQKPYIKKGATFLAIEMTPTGSEADSKPLHIVFPKIGTGKFSIPIRMTHDTRVFDLRIYTFGFAKSWVDQDPTWAPYIKDAGIRREFPQSNSGWKLRNPAIAKLLEGLHGEMAMFQMDAFNKEGGLRARQLKEDPTFLWDSVEAKPKF